MVMMIGFLALIGTMAFVWLKCTQMVGLVLIFGTQTLIMTQAGQIMMGERQLVLEHQIGAQKIIQDGLCGQ